MRFKAIGSVSFPHFDSDVERQCDVLTSKRAGVTAALGPCTSLRDRAGCLPRQPSPLLLLCVQ